MVALGSINTPIPRLSYKSVDDEAVMSIIETMHAYITNDKNKLSHCVAFVNAQRLKYNLALVLYSNVKYLTLSGVGI